VFNHHAANSAIVLDAPSVVVDGLGCSSHARRRRLPGTGNPSPFAAYPDTVNDPSAPRTRLPFGRLDTSTSLPGVTGSYGGSNALWYRSARVDTKWKFRLVSAIQ
jgi:hypothetical protein